jgi:transposase
MLISRRATALVLTDMFAAKLSTGSVEKILKDASRSFAEPWEAIKRAVQASDVAHADETSWRRAGERMWLWAALSATAACFVIDETRARSVAQDLLGDFDAIHVFDRYGVYAMLDPAHRHMCLAHLARNFAAHADTPGAPGRQARAP